MFGKEPAVVFNALGELARAIIPMLIIFGFIEWTADQTAQVFLVVGVSVTVLTTLLTRSQTVATDTANRQIETAVRMPADTTVAEVKVGRNRYVAVMGKLAGTFTIPLVPAGRMVDQNHAGKGSGAERAGAVRVDRVTFVSLHGDRFGDHAFVLVSLIHRTLLLWIFICPLSTKPAIGATGRRGKVGYPSFTLNPRMGVARVQRFRVSFLYTSVWGLLIVPMKSRVEGLGRLPLRFGATRTNRPERVYLSMFCFQP